MPRTAENPVFGQKREIDARPYARLRRPDGAAGRPAFSLCLSECRCYKILVPISPRVRRRPSLSCILAVHSGIHDTSAALFDDYRLLAAVQKERISRIKKDGGAPQACIEEVLAIAGLRADDVEVLALSRAEFPRRLFKPGCQPPGTGHPEAGATCDLSAAMAAAATFDPGAVLDVAGVVASYGLPPACQVFFANHHFAHALPALFHTDWEDALLYTADGAGDGVNYSHRVFKDGRLRTLFGDDRWLHRPRRADSLARAYGAVTRALGFRPGHHEGKLTGLAARGRPVLAERFDRRLRPDGDGLFADGFATVDELERFFTESCRGVAREDAAASIQLFVEERVLASVRRLVEREGIRHLGLGGGLFANVRLNQRLAEECGLAEVFVVPPMGDEGIAVGAALHYLLERDGLAPWLRHRHRLDHVYWGRPFPDAGARVAAASRTIARVEGNPATTAARLMAAGKAVAVFGQRMEFGPRALGARSIMASPARRAINDSLNRRLDREDFMPFAPVVAAEDAAQVFDVTPVNAYACRFMTITCGVKAEWRDRIPAVVHVDNTARPQVVRRRDNPLYYDILTSFRQQSGLPAAVNTSFNVHEQPIVNTPEEAAAALVEDRVDYLATEDGVYGVAGRP